MVERQKNELSPKNTVDISVSYYLGKMLGSFVRWFFLIAISFLILYPLIYMISMAFRSYTDFYDVTVVWVTKTFTLENFTKLFSELGIGDELLHTAIISFSATACQLIITSLVGYGFARFNFRGKNLVFFLVVLTILVPAPILNLSNYLLFNSFDFFGVFQAILGHPTNWSLLDGPQSFIIPAIFGQGLRSGLLILIFRQIYAGLPKELEEAAFMDGCGTFGTYVRIMLPNAGNAFLISGIFSVVWYWTDYYSATTFLSTYRTLAMEIPGIRTALGLVLEMEEQNVYHYIPMEQALCLVLIVPLLFVFVLLQKQFTNSIDKTGLVG